MKPNASALQLIVDRYAHLLRRMRLADWRAMHLPRGLPAGVAVAALSLAGALLAAPRARAADLIWDTGAGDGATITDGSGTWVDGGGNWNTGSGDATWSNATPDVAFFQGTSGGTATITVSGAVVQAGMNFGTLGDGDYLVTGGGSIGGDGYLLKDGVGTLTLDVAGSYTGGARVRGGTLVVQHDLALGAGGTTGVDPGATLRLEGGITVVGEDLILIGDGFNGAGALTSSGDNTWTADGFGVGSITVAYPGGRINSESGTLTLEASLWLEIGGYFGGAGDIDITGSLFGNGGLVKDGTGTLRLLMTDLGIGNIGAYDGTLVLASMFSSGSQLFIGDGIGDLDSAVFRLAATDGGSHSWTDVGVFDDGWLQIEHGVLSVTNLFASPGGHVTLGDGAGAAGSARINVGGLFFNQGRVEVAGADGLLALAGSAGNDGVLGVQDGRATVAGAFINAGTATIGDGDAFAATLDIGTTLTNDGTFTVRGNDGLGGGVDGTVNVGGAVTNNHVLAVGAGGGDPGSAVLNVGTDGAPANFVNSAGANVGADGLLRVTGSVVNSGAGATLTVDGGSLEAAQSLTNHGLLLVMGDGTASAMTVGNDGFIRLDGGTLEALVLVDNKAGGSVFVGNGDLGEVATLRSLGTLRNNDALTVDVDGVVETGSLINNQSLTTSGVVSVSGLLSNNGSFTQENGNVNVLGLANDSYASLLVHDGTLNTTGLVTNKPDATIAVGDDTTTAAAWNASGAVVNDGTIQVGGSGACVLNLSANLTGAGTTTIAAGGRMNLSNDADVANALTVDAGGEAVVKSGDSSLTGTVFNNGLLQVGDGSGAAGSAIARVAGPVFGDGEVRVLDDGLLILSNDMIADTSGGARLNILAGGQAWIGAISLLDGDLDNAGALTLAPRSGTLMVRGAFTQAGTGSLTVDLGTTLQVDGAATLAGNLYVTGLTAAGAADGDHVILDAASRTGTFANAAEGASVGTVGDVDFQVHYTATEVVIVPVLDDGSSGGPVNGDAGNAIADVGFEAGQVIMDEISGRMVRRLGAAPVAGAGGSADRATALDQNAGVTADGQTYHAYLIGRHDWFSRSGTDHDSTSLRVGVGLDVDLDQDWTIGAALGYGNRNTRRSTAESDLADLTLTGYARAVLLRRAHDAVVADFGAAAGTLHFESTRQTVAGTQGGESDGWALAAFGQVGWQLEAGPGATLTPYAGLRATSGWMDGYTETGAVAISVSDQQVANGQLYLGADYQRIHAFGSGDQWSWHAGLEGFAAVQDAGTELTLSGGGLATPLNVEPDADGWGVQAKVGAGVALADGWSVDAEGSARLTENGVGWQVGVQVIRSW